MGPGGLNPDPDVDPDVEPTTRARDGQTGHVRREDRGSPRGRPPGLSSASAWEDKRHHSTGLEGLHEPGTPDDRQGMSASLDTTDTIYAQVIASLLDTDDLPQFWD